MSQFFNTQKRVLVDQDRGKEQLEGMKEFCRIVLKEVDPRFTTQWQVDTSTGVVSHVTGIPIPAIKLTEQEMKEFLLYNRVMNVSSLKDVPDGFPTVGTKGYSFKYKGISWPIEIVENKFKGVK